MVPSDLARMMIGYHQDSPTLPNNVANHAPLKIFIIH